MIAVLLVCDRTAEAQGASPSLALRADGLWDASSAPSGTVLRYTLDGDDPTRDSGAWLAPVEVPPGYVLKVQAFTPDGAAVGDVMTRETVLPDGTTRRSSALVPVTQNRDWRVYDWNARHAAVVTLMRERRPEIVMIGDSITHFWGGDPVGGRRTAPEQWDRVFAGRRVVNLGYGWDRTENVLWRLTHGEFDDVAPAVAVVLIGTNNIGRNSPDEIAAGVEAICSAIRERSPHTRILLLGLLPRGERPNPARDAVGDVNRRLAALEGRRGITYLDIGASFLSTDGTISKDVMYDFLHPSARGYELWASAMSATLERLLLAEPVAARK